MALNKKRNPIEILLVEDSPTDVLLAREALEFSRICNRVQVVNDGAEAMAYLRQQGKYMDFPLPDLILLDLNLPKKDGRQVLREIKNDEKLKRIPVVVLTTSQHEADIFDSYDLHANCYIVKPVDFDKFAEVVKSIESFWFTVATLPSEKNK